MSQTISPPISNARVLPDEAKVSQIKNTRQLLDRIIEHACRVRTLLRGVDAQLCDMPASVIKDHDHALDVFLADMGQAMINIRQESAYDLLDEPIGPQHDDDDNPYIDAAKRIFRVLRMCFDIDADIDIKSSDLWVEYEHQRLRDQTIALIHGLYRLAGVAHFGPRLAAVTPYSVGTTNPFTDISHEITAIRVRLNDLFGRMEDENEKAASDLDDVLQQAVCSVDDIGDNIRDEWIDGTMMKREPQNALVADSEAA